ncbi:tetratricopeptide repeat protein [Oscillatoria acuminata]|uniref:Tetratricopeptide repeat protein n=1 Tax=Oscillatoria acuminata PCC 6304 TaxID=56110 RepID=K9TAY6_9CYAN|nr:hypothetical protein [Oscillatoria acuminata]AFY80057.1 hypothetical protein Oscil6304_0306 [Oscillatoria acuminata PCC 6304]
MVQKAKDKDGSSPKGMIRGVMLVSMVAFLGRLGFSTVQTFTSIREQPRSAEVARAESKERQSQLKAQERGYELVLEREPENKVALEGLINVRLEMNDSKGAIAPLEKLVRLDSNHPQYQEQLEQLKQQLEEDKGGVINN